MPCRLWAGAAQRVIWAIADAHGIDAYGVIEWACYDALDGVVEPRAGDAISLTAARVVVEDEFADNPYPALWQWGFVRAMRPEDIPGAPQTV